MGEKILITGGAGFIGSDVVAIALARGDEVPNLDINPPRDATQAPHWRQVDVRDREAIIGAITSKNMIAGTAN